MTRVACGVVRLTPNDRTPNWPRSGQSLIHVPLSRILRVGAANPVSRASPLRTSPDTRIARFNKQRSTMAPLRCATLLALLLFASLAGTTPSANAAFHLWQVKEVFSNASGSVQFVEM